MAEKKKWKKSSQELVDQFYSVMEGHPKVKLRKMFGYPCAFLNGNMVAGLHEENFTVRLEAKQREEALAKGVGSTFAPMKGRVMREYVALAPEVVSDKERLKSLLAASLAYAETLPSKEVEY